MYMIDARQENRPWFLAETRACFISEETRERLFHFGEVGVHNVIALVLATIAALWLIPRTPHSKNGW